MKRKIGIFLLLAVFAVSCCALAACNRNKGSSEILIADFETYEELTEMRWLNQFGSAELSSDYVTHGEQSLHVSAMGNLNAAAKPVICIDTKTDRLAKYDFTDVDKFKLDVYNDNDYDANVYFQYLTAAENQNKTSGEIKVTVPAKTAKTVEFVIDRALSAYFLNLDDVLQLRIAFDPIEESGQAYRSFYIDNLRAYTTSETFTPVNPRKEDEIESCDRPEYLAAWGNILAYVYSPSSLTFNSDPAYIKAGEGSFKLMSERTGGNGDLYTIGISCVNDPLEDFSTYAGLGYWVFNPNDIPIEAWLTGNYYMGTLQPGEWTYLEVTQQMFKEAQSGNHNADPSSLENFGPMFQVPDDKNYSLYIDEMYALKDGTEPVITVEDFVGEYPEKGVTVTVPKATVKYADGYTVKVYDPNGTLLDENIESFVAEEYGFYEIVYTATARRADAGGNYATVEERIQISVGTMPAFKDVPEKVVLSGTDEYTIVPPESDDGSVTWKAEVVNAYYPCYDHVLLGTIRDVDTDGYTDGVKEGENSDTVKVYDGTVVRITYQVTNNQNLYATAVQTVFYFGGEKQLNAVYSDLYSAGNTNGDLSVESDTDSIFGESGVLRLQSETGDAAGTFTPAQNVYLGASNNNLRFVVYNNGAKPVNFLVNGNGQATYELAAGDYLIFNGVMYGYEAALQGWKIVSEDKYLLPLTFTANSDAAVDLYIGRFTVNKNSFAPQVSVDDFGDVQSGTSIELKDYITVSGMEETFSYTISYSATENGNFEETASGNSDGVTTYVPDRSGWYIVEYRVKYAEGEVTSSKKFQAVGRELVFKNVPVDTFAPVGEYTITPPESDQGTVEWKAEVYEIFFSPGNCGNLRTDINGNGYVNGVKSGTGSDVVYIYENLAVRITYTVTDSLDQANTRNVYQTVINFTDSERLSESYKDFYTGATLSGALTLLTEAEKVFGDGGFRLSGDAVQSSGGYSATGTFTPAESAKYLGISNKNLRFVVYNSGSAEVTLTCNRFGGNSVTIAPQMSAVFNGAAYGYDAALIGWGLIENGNLNSMDFTATSMSPVDLRIGCFTVNKDSFVPEVSLNVQGSYMSGTSVDFTELISVEGNTGYIYVVKKKDGTQIASGSFDNHNAVTLSETGEYEVVYTVNYNKGTQSAQKIVTAVFRVDAFTVALGDESVKHIPIGTYKLEDNLPALQDGQHITAWTVQRYFVHILYGDFQPVDLMVSSEPDYAIVDENGCIIEFSALENYAYKVVYTISDGVNVASVTQWLLPETGSRLEEMHSESFASGHYGAEPGTSIEIGSEHVATDKAIVATGSGAVGFNFRPQADLGDNLNALTFWIMIESDSADTVHLNLGKNGNEWGGKNVPTGVWIRVNLDLNTILKVWGVVDSENVFQELGVRVTGEGNLTVYLDLFSVHKNNS